ncbi:type II toxin-antitoxin system RelE/ParE family toxin [bacterium]|nr:type II toxin-antitoxin system RelE/ParE family toxin [bacterium]
MNSKTISVHYNKRNANLVTRAAFWPGDSISSASQPVRVRTEKQRKTTRVSNKIIHKLRIKLSSSQARFLYFFTHHNYIIMYIAFYKTTDRVPDKFIRRTLTYREKFDLHITQNYLENIVHANN